MYFQAIALESTKKQHIQQQQQNHLRSLTKHRKNEMLKRKLSLC